VQPIDATDQTDRDLLGRYDSIIDVRSPGEFAEDHIPGAVNLPVLNNDERALVGTIYVQESRFNARRIGAAIVARNVAHHLETALANRPGSFRPLIYCWRGGQRSSAMATILAQVGWRCAVLTGGYKTYRRRVQSRLYDEDLALKVVLLDGHTGAGKTEVLARLGAVGVQTLDLEGLAEHRGSVFGGLSGCRQPSQKMFESRLLGALEGLDPVRPLVVEAESSKIGDRMIPPILWKAMLSAPRIELVAPRIERARRVVEIYADVVTDSASLIATLKRLPVWPGRRMLGEWSRLAEAGEYIALADSLMELHYDPAYLRSNRNDGRTKLATIVLEKLDEADLARAAGAVADFVAKS
jgi:tRNA 2-selenouridine synthase